MTKICCALTPLALVAVFMLTFAFDTKAQNLDCNNAATQMEMTECAGQEWKAADAELNAVYKQAMAKMREADGYLPDYLQGAAKTLKEAQRAWIPFRDKACESYGFLARGGSMEPMLVYGCLTTLTQKRISELKELSEGLGG